MQAWDKALTGGFADPVYEAQTVFRAVMDAMARPGTVASLALAIEPPAPFGLAQAAIALTLADPDTPVWLSPGLAGTSSSGSIPAGSGPGKSGPITTGATRTGIAEWLAFHTGAATTEARADCSFAFFEPGVSLPAFSQFAQGSQDYPDRSTTLVIEVEDLEGGPPLHLTGPGIRDRAELAPLGLPEAFLRQWQANRALFPRGIDAILTAGCQIACLPRSATVIIGEA